MKPNPESERALHSLLSEVAPPEFRAMVLDQTIRQARSRRRMRQACQVLKMTAAALVLLCWLASPRRLPEIAVVGPPADAPELGLIRTAPIDPSSIVSTEPGPTPVTTYASPAVAVVETDPARRLYREIDDDQLLLLCAGRPAALTRVGPDQVQLLFLDQ